MAWTTELPIIVRGLINDLDSTSYTDSRLQQYISICAKLVSSQISFDYTYTVDAVAVTISPDPTVAPDNAFINLICLRTASMIVTGEYKIQAGKGVIFRDGQTSLDTSKSVDGTKALMQMLNELYEQERLQFIGGVRCPSRIVTGAVANPDFAGRWPEYLGASARDRDGW